MPLILAGLFLLIILVNQFIRDFYYSETEKDLRDRTQLIGYWIKTNQTSLSIQNFVEESGSRANMRVTIVNEDGTVLGDSHESPSEMDNHGSRPEIIDAFTQGIGTSIRYSQTLKENLMYYGAPISMNKNNWVVRLSVPLTSLNLTIKALQKKIIILGIVIASGLLLMSFYFSKKIALPLENMRSAAERFSKEDLSKPILIPKTLELASLAESLNAMALNLNNRLMTITNERNEREAILSSMREGVLAIDENRKIFSLNTAACDYLNIDRNAGLNHTVDGIIRDSGFLEFLNDLLESTTTIEQEIKIKRNKDRFFLVKGNHIKMDNNPAGVLVVLNDITRQKQLEKIRQDFVANVSHELKTPITSIIGYMEILENGNAPEKQIQPFIGKVINHAKRLNYIISDLLKLSKIESQEEDNSIQLIGQPLVPILDGAIEDIKFVYSNQKLSFVSDCNTHIEVKADAQLLREALTNLLDNAVKYGKAGHRVTINVNVLDRVIINVHNVGEPILEKYGERIFQRFYRIDKSRNRDAGGTGLGLAIVKHIIYVHGGEITVDSSKQKGTTFSIYLPF